jgi:hypothetical protein
MIQKNNIIYASEGKVLKYKNSDCYMGTEVQLGYRYINNVKHEDTIDDFEEIEDDKDNLQINNELYNE